MQKMMVIHSIQILYQLLCDPVATHLFPIIHFWLLAHEVDMWI